MEGLGGHLHHGIPSTTEASQGPLKMSGIPRGRQDRGKHFPREEVRVSEDTDRSTAPAGLVAVRSTGKGQSKARRQVQVRTGTTGQSGVDTRGTQTAAPGGAEAGVRATRTPHKSATA